MPTFLWWFLLGAALGVTAMLPLLRVMLGRNEQRASDAQRRAAEAERLAELGAMTSGLAHEIKNPLSTVGLNAQLLREGIAETSMPSEEQARLLRRVDALRREVDRLSGILTDFLQFAGRVKLDPEPRDVVKLIDELCDFYHPQCDRAGVVLRSQVPPGSVIARIDEGLAKQALLNLMINATQAMAANRPEGRPAELMLRLEVAGDEARIHVTDTGPGIDASRVEEIFRPFVSQKPGGTGLGLPTARRIVQEHGGRIEVHSEPGRGSDFIVCLPVAVGTNETDPASGPAG
jgi:signal transduction histidine kinase